MMKQEFEELSGIIVSAQEYEIIQQVYMQYKRFSTKDKLIEFFGQYGMEGINRLFDNLNDIVSLNADIEEYYDNIREINERIKNKQNKIKAIKMLFDIE